MKSIIIALALLAAPTVLAEPLLSFEANVQASAEAAGHATVANATIGNASVVLGADIASTDGAPRSSQSDLAETHGAIPVAVTFSAGAPLLVAAAGAWVPGVRRGLGALTGVLVGGFSRIQEDELQDHPVRAQIVDILQETPGATIMDLESRLPVAWGTARYHLQRLEGGGLVVSEREGNGRRHWLRDDPLARKRKATKLLRSETPATIAAFVQKRPGMSQKEIRLELDLVPSVACRHLKRLASEGLLEVERVGRERRYRPADDLADLWGQAGKENVLAPKAQ